MMGASSLFPLSFHPMAELRMPDNITITAPQLSRSDAPATYYFTDFGISTMFSSNDTNRLVTGMDGLDDDVPELSDDVPYDPFKTDIFILGNMCRETFVEVRVFVRIL